MDPCKFTFDYGPIYEGFAHGSTWNGFDNVAVTKETLDKIVADFAADGADDDTLNSFRELTPLPSGLYSLGWGFSTRIVNYREPSAAEKTRVANIVRKPPGRRTEEEKALLRKHAGRER